jgi:hypothetical protein
MKLPLIMFISICLFFTLPSCGKKGLTIKAPGNIQIDDDDDDDDDGDDDQQVPCNEPFKVIVSWTDSSSGAATGYIVYYGPGPRNYDVQLDVGLTLTPSAPAAVLSGPFVMDVDYYFACTSYNNEGESYYSDEIVGRFECVDGYVKISDNIPSGLVATRIKSR